ncbi:FAD dependent oxidoreductase [Sulfobacillus acidophilus TPY]|nr:FAD dependent oxidoreductase [Sulfobacillus acidophilus TPY]
MRVHFTRQLTGEVLIGSNAVLVWAREQYQRRAFQVRDAWDVLTYPGFWRMVRRYGAAGLAELYRSLWVPAYLALSRRYVPDLAAADIVLGPVGIRAKPSMGQAG